MTDNNNEAWVCLTPKFGDNGQPLTFEQRLAHAANVLGAQSEQAFDDVFAQLLRIPELTHAQRVAAMRLVVDRLKSNMTETLTRVAEDLLIEHPAGPFVQRSKEVH